MPRVFWCIACCLVTGAAFAQSSDAGASDAPETEAQPPDEPGEAAKADDPNAATPEEIEQADKRDLSALAADNVTALLTELREGRIGTFIGGPLDRGKTGWDKMNTYLDEKAGLRLGIGYTALFQGASNGTGDPDLENIRYAASGDFDFFGQLRITAPDNINRSLVVFQLEHRHAYTEITPSELGAQIGSLWRTTSGFNDNSSIKQIYWDQRLADGKVQVRVGKIDQGAVLGSHKLENSNLYFLNSAFSSNPVAALPDNGFGVNVGYVPTDWFYVAGGIGDASGRSVEFDKILTDATFYRSLELGVVNETSLGNGHYRLTLWETDARPDAGLPDDSGLAIILGQELGEQFTLVGRYSTSDGLLTATEEMLMVALGVSSPLGFQDDYAGIGFAWGQPSDPTLRDQYVIEAFYRLQLASTVQVTPDVQVIFQPSNAPDDDVVGLFGLRLRVVY